MAEQELFPIPPRKRTPHGQVLQCRHNAIPYGADGSEVDAERVVAGAVEVSRIQQRRQAALGDKQTQYQGMNTLC